jgi:taurine--2-oxoglutarate transaminase
MSYPFYFTWSAQRDAHPIDIAGGEGAKFRDELGQEWLDLASLSYQASLGHGHPQMIAAIANQARRLCVAPPTAVFPAKTDLARALLELSPPSFTKVFFTLSGAEANENAMKIARLVTGRLKFVSRYRSYHGASLGALSLTGDYRRAPLEPLLPGIIRVGDDAAEIERVLESEGSQVAAVFLEPIPGANGVYIPPPDYFARVRAACDRHGVLLVLDEVLCGFGRTGACFGFEHFGIQPDMITCAKALTAGYAPLGAVLTHEKLAAHFDSRVLWAGLTSYAHPLGCAAGLAALKIYRSGRLFERAAALGEPFRAALVELAEGSPVAGEVRSIGLLGAVDLELSRAGWERLQRELARRHVLVHAYPRRGMIVFAPPLVIDESDLRAGLVIVAETLEAALTG